MKLRSLPLALRTMRAMRPRQIVAQLLHPVSRAVRPAVLRGPVPVLRTAHAATGFLAAPAHAKWSGSRLELITRSVVFGSDIDWDHGGEGLLWAFHLHQFDHARSIEISARARTRLVLDWIERHPQGVGWSPHPTSLRILAWGKLLLTEGALELDEPQHQLVCASLAKQIETLDRHLEVRLQANHLFSNLLGVVFGGLLLDGPRSERWLRRSSWLAREIEGQILPDGAHVERSPMYHSLLLENLLDLVNLAGGVENCPRPELVASARAACERMLRALEFFTQPDGQIALFADSAFGIAQSPARLTAYARSLGISTRGAPRVDVLKDAGYVRLDAEPFSLIASVAGPMPAHQPGHAHCDVGSFELCVGTERVITDTGVYEYIPGERRDAARSVRNHSTLEVAGAEQAELWAAHRIGARPRVQRVPVEEPDTFEVSCASYSTLDSLHRRRAVISSDEVVIHDSLEGATQPVRSRLLFAPGLEPRLEAGEGGASLALIELASGAQLQIDLPTALKWQVVRAPYFPEFGCEIDRACLLGEAPAFVRGRIRFSLRAEA